MYYMIISWHVGRFLKKINWSLWLKFYKFHLFSIIYYWPTSPRVHIRNVMVNQQLSALYAVYIGQPDKFNNDIVASFGGLITSYLKTLTPPPQLWQTIPFVCPMISLQIWSQCLIKILIISVFFDHTELSYNFLF